jgi:hypothetical protein
MGKLVLLQCPHCERILKMEIFDFPRRYRCSECNERMIILPDGFFENGSRVVPLPGNE